MTALLIDLKLDPGKLLIHGINKLMSLRRYFRKKRFRLTDMIAYLKRTEMSAQEK